MEESHYFFKTIGLESYISGQEKNFCDSPPRVDLDNLEYPSLTYSKTKEDEHVGDKKQDQAVKEALNVKEGINDDFNQEAANIQADDFFLSLELQSSSKTSPANVISLSFHNKIYGGIVTRSRSFSSSVHETARTSDKIEIKSREKKKKISREIIQKEKKNQKKSRKYYKTKTKKRRKKIMLDKKPLSEKKDKMTELAEEKKICSAKVMEDNNLEKNLEIQKNKDEDARKKEVDLKSFESKQIVNSDMLTPARRSTPELFSMSPILMGDAVSEEKDDVDNLLEVDEYEDNDDDDNFLDEMVEFNAPPRSHTGGKWKPGSLSIRTSPNLWQSQNWESFLDDRNQYDKGKMKSEIASDSPSESKTTISTGGKWKCYAPPASHTGGKWKPITPPATHTSGKWKPQTYSATYNNEKWKLPEGIHRSIKLEEALSPDNSNSNWKCENQKEPEQSLCHTGGKWKPNSLFNQPSESLSLLKVKDKIPPPTHTRGKWVVETGKNLLKRSSLDVLASCQSSSGKCLKTSGGMIQYYCSPCNRRLSSKKMYKKHIQSELHFKRVLHEIELEFDPRSLKLYRGLMTQTSQRERGLGKRIIKKPDLYEGDDLIKEKKSLPSVKVKGRRVPKREIIRCEVCKIKVPSYQLGKHLVSYYHSRRIKLNDPEQRKLILNNIHAIVKQAPYQCDLCKFYCNTHNLFKNHWALDCHKEIKEAENRRFWCSLCSFECETALFMELHLDSNSHREVIQAVNKSIPIIIRHKVIITCDICFKEFRYNRELYRHKQIFHELKESNTILKFACTFCQHNCKSMKALQRHILNNHKGNAKVPYFCSGCNEFFATATDAKNHRNSQEHKYKKKLSEEGSNCKKTLSRICSFCNDTLENIGSLKRHLFDKHSSFLPKCIKCGMIFALSQEVSKHVRNNECDFSGKINQPSTNQMFTCETCAFTTNSKSELLLHGTIHQKTDKFDKKIPCPLCGSRLTQSALSIHLKTHLKELTYQCSLCSKAFVRKDRFMSHMKTKHFTKKINDGNDLESCDRESSVVLDEEMKIMKKEAEKNIQNDKETNEKIVVETMKTCSDRKGEIVVKEEKNLEKQNFIEIGPKVFQCPDCSYCAKKNTILKRHYMIHSDERSFPCPYCSFKARLKAHLKRHLRLHTGAKPYKCPHCSYSCNNLENLRKHVLRTKMHPGKKLYECKLCSFDTNVLKTFKVHLTTSHKDFCHPSEANTAAGIYSKDKDVINTDNPILKKVKTSASTSNQVCARPIASELKEKIDVTYKKFRPIACKTTLIEKKVSPPSLKATGNSVEDKRKVLETELKKLKKQINPDTKIIYKSYPSPAEKDSKAKLKTEVGLGLSKDVAHDEKVLVKAKEVPNEIGNVMKTENEILLIDYAVLEETFTKDVRTSKSNPMTQQLSPSFILYNDVLPPDEKKLYLLEDYEV